jgi:universal stress protein E
MTEANDIARVLAAIALVDGNDDVTRRAAFFAVERGWALDVVHVLEVDVLTRVQRLFGAEEDLSARVEAGLLRAVHRQVHEAIGSTTEPSIHLERGPVVARIAELAANPPPALLVIGARGDHPLQRLFLGTTAEQVLRAVEQPTLVVKVPPRESYQRVIVGVDLEDTSARALRVARTLVPDASFELVHAFELLHRVKLTRAGLPPAELDAAARRGSQLATAELQAFAARHPALTAGAGRAVLDGEPSRVLLDQAAIHQADLVVVGRQSKGLLDGLLLGSVAARIVNQSTIDVLVA